MKLKVANNFGILYLSSLTTDLKLKKKVDYSESLRIGVVVVAVHKYHIREVVGVRWNVQNLCAFDAAQPR